MNRKLKWPLLLGFVLVFLAGTATGFFGGAWQAHRAFDERHGRMMGARMRERLQQQLELTPEQLRQVDPILRQTAQRLQEIRSETGERVAQTMEESHQEMAAHLTPAQVTKLKQMRARHEEHQRLRHERRKERRRARDEAKQQ